MEQLRRDLDQRDAGAPPCQVMTVRLVNKMARIAKALMDCKEVYRAKGRVAAATEAAA